MTRFQTAICAALLAASAAQADTAGISGTPSGEGPPNMVVCRNPQTLPGSRLLGPRVCRINATWAQYRKDGMDLAPDGLRIVPSEKFRSLNPAACRLATPGGGGIVNMVQANMSMLCD